MKVLVKIETWVFITLYFQQPCDSHTYDEYSKTGEQIKYTIITTVKESVGLQHTPLATPPNSTNFNNDPLVGSDIIETDDVRIFSTF